MQIDKDDRYVSDASHKALTPSKGPSIFRQLLKPRALILILVVALLMLIFIMSLSLNKEDDSWVVPPNKLDKTQSTNTTNNNIAKNIDLKLPPMTSEKSKVSSLTDSSTETKTKTPIETSTKTSTATTAKTAIETSDKTAVDKAIETTVEPSVDDKKQPEKIAVTTSVKPPITANNSPTENKTATLVNKAGRQQASATNDRKEGKTIIANNHFSIQLVGSTSLENIKKLITEYNLKNAHIYETRRNDMSWYVLLQGDYLTLDAAREAIKSLPEEFQKNKAWAKAGTVINKEMAMSPTQPN